MHEKSNADECSKVSFVKNPKKNNYDVYLEGKYIISVCEDDFIRYNLYDRDELSHQEIAELIKSLNLRRAKFIAIRFISSKARSTKEVYVKLSNEEFGVDIIDTVLTELTESGYLDDAEYARKFILDRIRLNPKSKRFIAMELKNKGIDSSVIDETFADIDFDEDDIVSEIVRRKFGKLDITDEKVKKRVRSFLAYRGFGNKFEDGY